MRPVGLANAKSPRSEDFFKVFPAALLENQDAVVEILSSATALANSFCWREKKKPFAPPKMCEPSFGKSANEFVPSFEASYLTFLSAWKKEKLFGCTQIPKDGDHYQ